ncbi:sugar-binding transcriptional regulator [Siminovitchia fortis]|uniref:sugar-binding transcriptional regulator n=1 Tax=Siminovitchia fortis TaxID=254758 RepID=UPI0011A6529B|nr:sugar-binding domain-containing protein [Siminovitchia fortis]
MKELLKLQQQLVPDLLDAMERRYFVLRSIRLTEPVGRRPLAQMLDMTERVLRGEVEFLKDRHLIDFQPAGMRLTSDGRKLLTKLEDLMKEIIGIHKAEKQLSEHLGIAETIIVPGDSDKMPLIKDEIGKACARRLAALLDEKNTITVTGGTTMGSVAKALMDINVAGREMLFVPARGGVGGKVSDQANSICAAMAENTGGTHRVLYVPDEVSDELRSILLKEPSINNTLSLIRSADIVLHGIGEAMKMAERRNTDEESMDKIMKGHAVGEAFGYYFDLDGNIVHKVSTIGLQLKDLPRFKHVIAAAGGKSKAKAIRSYMKNAPKSTVLVTDEGAAAEILKEE